MEEIWKPIEGFEGRYEVSNLGRVRSLDRIIKRDNGHGVNDARVKGRILSQKLNHKGGYCVVNINDNGRELTKYVHRLVAQAFIPNPDGLPEVNHKDEDKQNNCVSNLEWCTPAYNSNYGTGHERMMLKTSKPIVAVDDSGNIVKEYPSVKAAIRDGANRGGIYACIKNPNRRHMGLHWKYKE